MEESIGFACCTGPAGLIFHFRGIFPGADTVLSGLRDTHRQGCEMVVYLLGNAMRQRSEMHNPSSPLRLKKRNLTFWGSFSFLVSTEGGKKKKEEEIVMVPAGDCHKHLPCDNDGEAQQRWSKEGGVWRSGGVTSWTSPSCEPHL